MYKPNHKQKAIIVINIKILFLIEFDFVTVITTKNIFAFFQL